jgi:hypothetical protein
MAPAGNWRGSNSIKRCVNAEGVRIAKDPLAVTVSRWDRGRKELTVSMLSPRLHISVDG